MRILWAFLSLKWYLCMQQSPLLITTVSLLRTMTQLMWFHGPTVWNQRPKPRYWMLASLKQVNRYICDKSFRSIYWEKRICLVLIYSCGLNSSSFQYYAHRYRMFSWLEPEPSNINDHFGADSWRRHKYTRRTGRTTWPRVHIKSTA